MPLKMYLNAGCNGLYTQLQNALASNNTLWFAVPNIVFAIEAGILKSKHWLGMLMEVFKEVHNISLH